MALMTSPEQVATPSVTATVLPMMAVIFAGYLVIGIAMPVLPLHVHQTLGFGTFAVGLVAGCQFGASLASRFGAGQRPGRDRDSDAAARKQPLRDRLIPIQPPDIVRAATDPCARRHG